MIWIAVVPAQDFASLSGVTQWAICLNIGD